VTEDRRSTIERIKRADSWTENKCSLCPLLGSTCSCVYSYWLWRLDKENRTWIEGNQELSLRKSTNLQVLRVVIFQDLFCPVSLSPCFLYFRLPRIEAIWLLLCRP
jgi:hypothetical protein